jgi:hypothetical protein
MIDISRTGKLATLEIFILPMLISASKLSVSAVLLPALSLPPHFIYDIVQHCRYFNTVMPGQDFDPPGL